jgi:hypothetical protein
MASSLALGAASWGTGRIDLFGVGFDKALYHKAFGGSNTDGWDPYWINWGGIITSPPSVVSWGPNRIDVFVLGEPNGANQ